MTRQDEARQDSTRQHKHNTRQTVVEEYALCLIGEALREKDHVKRVEQWKSCLVLSRFVLSRLVFRLSYLVVFLSSGILFLRCLFLHCVALYCVVPPCSVLRCVALCCVVLCRLILSRFVLSAGTFYIVLAVDLALPWPPSVATPLVAAHTCISRENEQTPGVIWSPEEESVWHVYLPCLCLTLSLSYLVLCLSMSLLSCLVSSPRLAWSGMLSSGLVWFCLVLSSLV